MTDGQYRALVAYLKYWTKMYPNFDLDAAISDIGIAEDRETVLLELAKAGHHYDEKTGKLRGV